MNVAMIDFYLKMTVIASKLCTLKSFVRSEFVLPVPYRHCDDLQNK